jgi:PPK2 family polyphosphate:nucleotide phosphotransferase
VPSELERVHDYLWRSALWLPRRGDIGIFNRSYYEEVLIVRVHPEILRAQRLPESARDGDVWTRRYREINEWERHLVDNGTVVVKVFLNLSKEEQRQRFLARVEEQDKNWKFSVSDVRERQHWDDYQHAYSQMLTHTSTEWAPWYVVPADRKWFARICVSAIMAHTLMTIDPQYPVLDAEGLAALAQARDQLLAEDG